MKITGLKVLLFAPRRNPIQEVPEYITSPTRQQGVAIVSTDEGVQGIVPSEGNSLRQFARLWAGAREVIEGVDPFDRGKLDSLLRNRFYWPEAQLGVMDFALWDIAGKACGKPVYKLLGATRDKIRAYGSTVHHATDEQFIETALRCKEMGFKAVKLHPYCEFEDDVRLVYKVRKAVGDDLTLMSDTLIYPGPYNRDQAFRMGRILDELNFWWFEDPLARTDVDGLSELVRECKVVQIRMSDRVERIGEYAAMIKHRCADILAGPPSFGITALMKLSALAEANNMKVEVHNFGEGTASLHVVLAMGNTDYYEQPVPEGCFDNELYPGVYLNPVRIDKEGYVHAPALPGLGFEIDMKEAEKVSVETI